MAQRLKRLPGIQETPVQSLSWEDPLEKEMATHSSTLAWRIPWREKPGRLQSMGSQRVGHDGATSLFYRYSCINTRKSETSKQANNLIIPSVGEDVVQLKTHIAGGNIK